MCQKQKQLLIAEFNKLGIEGMPEVTELHEYEGSFVNLEYTLPNGTAAKFWEDSKTYFILEIPKTDDRCFGLIGGEHYLMVCEYGRDGENPEILVFKKWN